MARWWCWSGLGGLENGCGHGGRCGHTTATYRRSGSEHTEASTGAAMLIFVGKCQLPERITQGGEGEPSCIGLDQFALHFVTTGVPDPSKRKVMLIIHAMNRWKNVCITYIPAYICMRYPCGQGKENVNQFLEVERIPNLFMRKFCVAAKTSCHMST